MNAPPPQHLLPEIHQRATPQALIDALKARFAERCSTALVVREQHGRDESVVRRAAARCRGVCRKHAGRGRRGEAGRRSTACR